MSSQSNSVGSIQNIWRYAVKSMGGEELNEALVTDGGLLGDRGYAVIDQATGRALGLFSYLRIMALDGSIEIGHVAFGAPMQRTAGATEAIYLLARHAFDDLGYRRLEWKCDAANARSERAAERFGFTREGLFRQHMVRKGRNRDTAWFSIIDGEWPGCRNAFQLWLAAENFDEQGQQRQRLEALRG